MCFCTIGKIYLVTFSLSYFQPAKCSSSDTSNNDDNENSDDGNMSPTEVLDVIEDAKAFQRNLKNNIERFLDAEQTSALAKQEAVEPICGKVNTSKNTLSDSFCED